MNHIAFLSGILVMGIGASILPTNITKLTATVLGFCLAMCGASWANFHWSLVSIFALVFLGIAVLSALFSKTRKPLVFLPNLMRSDGIVTQVMFVGLAIFTSQLTGADRDIVIQALLWTAAIIGVVAYWQSNGEAQWSLAAGLSPEMARTNFRAMSTLANPLFLGGYCTLVLPIALARAAMWMRPEDLIVSGLLTYAAIASGSRGAWLAIIVALPVILVTHPILTALSAIGVMLLVTGIVAYARKQYLQRVSIKEVVRDSVHSTVSGRRYVGKLIWDELLKSPWLGYGWNSFRQPNPDPAASDFYDKAHADILDTAHAVGFIGLAFYLAMWGAAMWGAGPMFLAGLIAYFIWSQFGWQHLGPAGIFYTVLGLVAVIK